MTHTGDLKKFLFLVPFIVGAVVVLAAGGWSISAGHVVSGIGSVVTGAAVGLFFLVMLSKRIARYHPLLPLQNLGAIGGAIASVVGVVALQEAAPLPLVVGTAVVGVVGMPLYTLWYARLPQRGDVVAVGQPFPDVTFTDVDGASWPTSRLKGQPSFLLFFRGNWCPLCMAQIREVAALYRQLEERGARVLLVSGQSERDTQELASQFDVTFTHLRDPDLVVAKQLGLFHGKAAALGLGILFRTAREPDAYLPTIVLVDDGGVVRAVDATDNYLVRPEPETLLRLMDEHLSV